jgi:predicted neuraminidase
VPTTLPSNNSGIQACQLSSGALAMVFNNVRGAHARSPLTIALSVDHGASFVRARDLETGGGEMSYPSIVQTPDGTIHLSYTYRRRTIKYTVLTEGWVRKGGAYQPPAT